MAEPMKTSAVLCREQGVVVVEDVLVAPPAENQVRVRISACGVCHSDLSAVQGKIRLPLPLLLGHEASGIVESVGSGVRELKPGDHVLTSFVGMCGKCHFCSSGRPQLCEQGLRAAYRLPDGSSPVSDLQGESLNVFSACGVMAGYATLDVGSVVRIDPDMPLEPAALISCGVMTGVGAIMNTARVEAGSTVVVIGAGGVGLNAIQAAALVGASRVIAVDTSEDKLLLASEFGATDRIVVSPEDDWGKQVKRMTDGGADYCFDCVGRGSVLEGAMKAARRGGTVVSVGVAPADDMTQVRTAALTFEEKTLRGSYFGSARPRVDFPRLVSLYQAGKLKLDELITRRYLLAEAPQAFADLQAGRNARGLLVMS
jgi:Zn-dependent alcohol dehydrogenase